jgi:cytochrome oxidase Cu insertion factor (SCO1/SenC/PrrC family)
MKRWRTAVVMLLTLVLGGSLYAGWGRARESSTRALPMVGYAAPDFSLKGVDGVQYRLTAYRGQVVFLNFWAGW